MSKSFYTTPISQTSATVGAILGLPDVEPGRVLQNLAVQATNAHVGCVVLLHPTAMGTASFEHFSGSFGRVLSLCPNAEPMASVYPVRADDALRQIYHADGQSLWAQLRAKRLRSALVVTAESPILEVARADGAEVHIKKDELSAVYQTIDLIKTGEYALISVVLDDYHQVMHLSHPQSKQCAKCVDLLSAEVDLVVSAMAVYTPCNSLAIWLPTHGSSRGILRAGTHRACTPDNINVTMQWGIVSSLIR